MVERPDKITMPVMPPGNQEKENVPEPDARIGKRIADNISDDFFQAANSTGRFSFFFFSCNCRMARSMA
jgi:hypothetical protein